MMISPEAFYETELKGKSQKELLKVISSLKREIKNFKKHIEEGTHPEEDMILPNRLTRISMDREYLKQAIKAYEETGKEYPYTAAERKALEFNEALNSFKSLKVLYNGYYLFSSKRITCIEDGDDVKITIDALDDNHKPSFSTIETIDKTDFIDELKELYIGEWDKKYVVLAEGGVQWKLTFEFSNGIKPISFSGSNAVPYNFNQLEELLGINDGEINVYKEVDPHAELKDPDPIDTIMDRQRSEHAIKYGERLTAQQLKDAFGVSGRYCLTHSSIDQSSFLFCGKSVGGNTHTKITNSGKITVSTELKPKQSYENGLRPEDTEIGNVVFVIERESMNSFIYRGIADLDELEVVRKSRSDVYAWNMECILRGKIRKEENAYKYQIVDTDTLETAVYVPTPEGTKRAVYTTKYERKKANRDAAIVAHGTKCMACGFDFEKVYGEYGKGYIEVHHIKPLFESDEEITPDPEKDLICLCSNCHRMVHHFKNKVLSLEELKQLLAEAKLV